MKLVSVLVFLSAYSVTSSLVVEVPPACPKTAAEALMVSRLEDLITCSPSKLVRFYRQLDCCFVNIAECNKISKAFQIEGGPPDKSIGASCFQFKTVSEAISTTGLSCRP